MSHTPPDRAIGFDYTSLKRLITEQYGNREFARRMAMRPDRLDALLTGQREFSQEEIIRAVALLNIGAVEVAHHFFSPIV